MTFNTLSIFDPYVSLISQRLYVSEFDKDTLEKTVKTTKNGLPTENKGLGITQYFSFVGPILKLLGIALQTKNEKGETIYVNKSSFSHYILRLKEGTESSSRRTKNGCVTTITNINVNKVNKLYEMNKITRDQIKDQNAILTSNWDPNKNIHKLTHNFLKI